tara:strand:+ start:520 stop:969 length:450 start_codon:yes stop_codon:yes gene_type:complete
MPNELNRHLQLNAPQEGNLLNQYVDALRPYISIDGGISGSVKDSNITLPGDDGHIRSMNIGGGGRAGVKIPINELIMRLGASGYFSKHRTEFDSNMQGVGAPDQVSGYDAGLTGLDAGINFRNGIDVGARYNPQNPRDKEIMLRYKKNF